MDSTTNDGRQNPPNSSTPSDESGYASDLAIRMRERLKADVQRAVGGYFNLWRELSRISFEIDRSVTAEWLIKRVQFLAWELHSLLPNDATDLERFEKLNQFFFKNLGFQSSDWTKSKSHHAEGFRLGPFMIARSGAAKLNAILYACLAEQLGLQLELVKTSPTRLLKWCENGQSRFVDLASGGRFLASEELLDFLHSYFPSEKSCDLETHSFDSFVCEFVTELKTSLIMSPAKAEASVLLFLQNVLISYQPSQLQLLAERALLYRRLGSFKSALADLKRYFSFYQKDKAPTELIKLHDDLIRMLDRQRSGLDLVD